MEPIVSSETSAIRTQTPENYPKRNKLHKNILLIKNNNQVVFDYILRIYFMVNATDITIIPKIYFCSISAQKFW